MKVVIELLAGTFIMLPIIVLVVSYWILRKLTKQPSKSFGYSADVTTFFLIFSVYLSISTLWNGRLGAIIFSVALMIAIVMTYIEWRKKVEIEVIPLLRKIWRIHFVYLSLVYLAIWIIGIIQSIIVFTT